jgi:hypothetical protein
MDEVSVILGYEVVTGYAKFEITRLFVNVGDQLFSDGGIISKKNGYLACGCFYRKTLRTAVLYDVTPCIVADFCPRFRGTCCLLF